jgi:diguanylate cyclase (GGDEF)-like protein
MGSFKFRLVAYFVLLAMLPVLAASWAFSEVAARGETSKVDSRLNSALRVAVAAYAEDVATAADVASALAIRPSVQRAFALEDTESLVALTRGAPRTALFIDGHLVAGRRPPGPAAERSAVVVSPSGHRVGRILTWVPLNEGLLQNLRRSAGLESTDRLIFVSGSKVIAGAPELAGGAVDLSSGYSQYVTLEGKSYRAVGTALVDGADGVSLVAVTPKGEVDAAIRALRANLLLFALGALAFVAMVAYGFGRPIVRSLRELSDAARAVAQGRFERRVPVRGHDEFAVLTRAFNDMAAQLETRLEELAEERARVQGVISRLGDALSATHDARTLLPIIVESAVEATAATGGRLLQDDREVALAGDPDTDREPLEIALGEGHAVLLLYPTEKGFSNESRELAQRLAAQATVALENARVHRRVKLQAVTDGLTELANRRQFEDALSGEMSRIDRFGGSLGLIYADLDDFKAVNDRFGHQAGDDVLKAFAEVLRRNVRDIDVPARHGGEEFAVLLPQTDLEGTEHLAGRIREDLASEAIETVAGPVRVTASFGVASFPDAPTQDALLAAADRALYRAKHSGKNCVVAAHEGTPVRPQG